MKKRILFIVWSFTAGGGAEKVLANLINNLDDNIYEISVIEFLHFGVKNEPLKSHIKVLKPINISPSSNLYKSYSYSKKIFTKIKNKINNYLIFKYPKLIRKMEVKEKYDIEIAFNYMIPSILVGCSSAGKKYTWVHGSIEELNDLKKYQNQYKFQKEAFENMDKIIAISKKTERSIIDIYPEYKYKVVKIYNGYDFDVIVQKSSYKIELNSIEPIIIGIGRLDNNKNFNLLINAANILNQRGIQYKILLLGEGEERAALEKKIREYKLEDKICLLGFIDNPYPYIKQSYLLCVTSLSEGFPTVIVEGMHLGCPFISTPVAGIEELSEGGECGLICSYDKYDLADKIEFLFKNSDYRNKMSDKCMNKTYKYQNNNFINEVNKLL